MSRFFNVHYADAKGKILEKPNVGIEISSQTSVPADGTAGYGAGCLLFVEGATVAAGQLFKNEGTNTSCSFRQLASIGVNLPNIAGGSTLTLTAALHRGRTINLDTLAGTTITLPAATGSGDVYKFLVTVIATSNNHIIKVANVNDSMSGFIFTQSDDAGLPVKGYFAALNDDTITLNRTTTGSVKVGEYITIQDYATNLFSVQGFTSSTGTEATPFSATV